MMMTGKISTGKLLEVPTHRKFWICLAWGLAALLCLVPSGSSAFEESPEQAETGSVPFVMLPSNHMAVRAELGEDRTKAWLIFDLGAPVTLLNNRAGRASGAIAKNAPRSFLFGVSGEGKVEGMVLGDVTIDELPVIIMDHPALAALSSFFRRIDGIVGYTFFAQYRTTIDYQTKTMTFTKVDNEVTDLMTTLPNRMLGPKTPKRRQIAPRGAWGLKLGQREDLESPGVPILEVVEGSAAEAASLQVGDILAEVDGRWTLSVADAYEAASKFEGSLEDGIAVKVVRDGEEMSLTIRPRQGL